MIKLLHGADLHLDSPFHGLSPQQAARRRQEQRQILQELPEICHSTGSQLVLLAGDLFDGAVVFQETLELLCRSLKDCAVPVFIAPGNHDFYGPGSPYQTLAWPDNVHIFKSSQIESVDLPELSCRVYGAAFLSAESPPLLSGFRAEEPGLCSLMVLHGETDAPASRYNPISQEQIAASGLSYLALGHIHKASGLRRAGATVYGWPGCAMGRGFDEQGTKGLYQITIDQEPTAAFLPLPGLRYYDLTAQAGDDPAAAAAAAIPEEARGQIVRLTLTGPAEPPDLPELERVLAPGFFSLTLRDRTTPKWDLWAQTGQDSLKGLFLQLLQDKIAQDPLSREQAEAAASLTLGVMEGREVELL